MLRQLLAGLLRSRSAPAKPGRDTPSPTEIVDMINAGEAREAIPHLERLIARSPGDVDALSNLACCLAETGDFERAGRLLSQACLIDDTHFAASLNYARHLSSVNRSTDAIERLRLARIYQPSHPTIDSALAVIALNRGDAATASRLSAEAWLALPNVLRAANCKLFHHTYDDIDEARLASEHVFWAETLAPLPATDSLDEFPGDWARALALPAKSPGRVRIAYWSPDLRDHSVRYFFRPLLDNHDRERFEVVIYHDSPQRDAQTELIRGSADHFLDVTSLPDRRLRALMKSHDLDVLVELAGHTGENRIRLMADRYAALQLTALGYPPTTGLSSIDCKVIDEYVATEDADLYYSERPLTLPGSFWCFDPLQDTPIEPAPAAERNGYVTFAVLGNIAKTNPRMFKAWRDILDAVPSARLVFRSISFGDADALKHFTHRLLDHGLPEDRLRFEPPVSTGTELLRTYADIDIVLDTYPFNGGTTSCFAVHMGVPIVSRYGKSLPSRMGLSILKNVGLGDWASDTDAGYVRNAVRAAADIAFLRRFRAEVRSRLKASPLGNGALYAKHFESGVEDALARKRQGIPYRHRVAPLPAEVMVDRARKARARGQTGFCSRILHHCLQCHPGYGPAHLLLAEIMSDAGKPHDAVSYREAHLETLSPDAERSAHLSSAIDFLITGEPASAGRELEALVNLGNLTQEERLHAALARAAIDTSGPNGTTLTQPLRKSGHPRFLVLIPCGELAEFQRIRDELLAAAHGVDEALIEFRQCNERLRAPAYRAAFNEKGQDILVLVQKHLSFANPHLFATLADALEQLEGLSFAGAVTRDILNWRTSDRHHRAGSILIAPRPDRARRHGFEVQVTGLASHGAVASGHLVLDGAFLALRREAALAHGADALDPLLEESAGLMEDALSHALARAGARLGVHPALGIIWRHDATLPNLQEFDARRHLAEKLDLAVDPFETPQQDHFRVSVPASSPSHAFAIQVALAEAMARQDGLGHSPHLSR